MVDPERPVQPETRGCLSLEARTPEPGRMLSDAQDSALVGPVLIDYIDPHFPF